MFKTITAISLVALLLGCAGTEKPAANISCAGQNWKELGMQAAKALEPVRTFDTYIESCGPSLDPGAKAAFVDGYARALVDICTYKSGFDLGAKNSELPDVCPLEIRADFQQGYAQGQREYDEKMRHLKKMSDDRDQREILPHNKGTRYGLGDSGQSTEVGP
jgi:hypothetical protein